MATNHLVQHTQNRTRNLLFFLSLSLLPLYTFSRSRWIPRLGLDQLHLILIQLIFTFLFSHTFSSPSAISPASKNGDTNKDDGPRQNDGERKNIWNTSHGIAKGLQELIDQPADWINVFPTPGIEILKHRSINSLYAVRTELEVDQNVNLEQLIRSIRDSKQWEWDRMCECGQDLGDGVTWVRLKGFWPIKPKELVLRSCMVRLPSSNWKSADGVDSRTPIRILAASSSTSHPLKKSTLEIKFAGYLIEQDSPSSGLRITQVVDLSGFGVLPTFVTKAILCKFIPSSLRKLVALAQRLPPLSPSSEPTQDPPAWMPPTLDDSITCTTATPTASNEGERLRMEIDQLKNIIHNLQPQKQMNKSEDSSLWTNRLSMASIAGTALAVCVSFAYKKGLLNRREKRNIPLGTEWAPDDLVLLLELLSRKRE